MKGNKGITLIALIITIIILLILAIVSINLITNNGILKHAQNATDSYQIAQEKETIKIAYTNYQASKFVKEPVPETTDEYEYLKTYFIDSGRNLNTDIIDEENSNEEKGIYKFQDIDITYYLTEETYIETAEDVSIIFNYKGYQYKATFDKTSGECSKLDILAKLNELKVPGAVVTESEYGGWNIIFNKSKNAYSIELDGRIIANRWWELTEEEKIKIVFGCNYGIVAENDTFVVLTKSVSQEGEVDVVSITNIKEVNENTEYPTCWFVASDKGKEYIEEEVGVKVEKYRWYKTSDNSAFRDWQEYNEPSPITMADFKEEDIVVKSYLERIIDSFNS